MLKCEDVCVCETRDRVLIQWYEGGYMVMKLCSISGDQPEDVDGFVKIHLGI